jgi:SAM-dependent methyltransferase
MTSEVLLVDYDFRLVRDVIPDAEFHQNRYARAVTSDLVKQKRWLDLGAGRRLHGGWLGEPEVELAKAADILIGFDLDIEGIAANPQLHYRIGGDGMALPFKDASFDLVTANMVLEHIAEPGDVFSEVSRVLRPGGQFIFVTPNRKHPIVRTMKAILTARQRRLVAQVAEGRSQLDVFPTYYRANTCDALAQLAKQAGLTPVTLEVFSSYPMFRKPRVLTFVEVLFIRATLRLPSMRRFSSNIFGTLQRPGT